MFITTPKCISVHKSKSEIQEYNRKQMDGNQRYRQTKQINETKKNSSSRRYSNCALNKQKASITVNKQEKKQIHAFKRNSLVKPKNSNIQEQRFNHALKRSSLVNSQQKYIEQSLRKSNENKSKFVIEQKRNQKQQHNFVSSQQWRKQNITYDDVFFQKKNAKGAGLSGLSSTINILGKNNAQLPGKIGLTLESKWQKLMELYTMRDELSKKYHFASHNHLKKNFPILPGADFYRILIKNQLFQKQWKINFPQTLFLDNDANIVMIYTDTQSGILKKKYIQKQGKQKDKYRDQVLKFKQDFLECLQKQNKMRLFKSIKIQQNPNAPLSIIKYTEDNSFQFQTDVQSCRNFFQRKLKPTRDSIVQKYIYSNNLKAMVFRLYFRKRVRGEANSGPEYQGIKFQNQRSIFKQPGSSSFAETHKLTSTISLSQKRIGTLKTCKISNPKALQKFIKIEQQLRAMLEYSEKVVIDKLYLDFIVDVFDKPWVINLKYCQVNPHCLIHGTSKFDHVSNVSSCRLCGAIQNKENLKNSVSVRMLCEFIWHLRKRTKHQDQHKIDFLNNININSKQNKTSSVCKICYKVIIHELQLIKMEKQLAQICNIIPQASNDYFESDINNSNSKSMSSIGQYKQWRLMFYFEDIKNMIPKCSSNSSGFENNYNNYQRNNQVQKNNQNRSHWHKRNSNYSSNTHKDFCGYNKGIREDEYNENEFILKYTLCPKIAESFTCKRQSRLNNNLKVNQVKLHYFYSETPSIEEFINNTQISISLYSTGGSVAGKGSSAQNSNPNSKAQNQRGQSNRHQGNPKHNNYSNHQNAEKRVPNQKTISSDKLFNPQKLIASGSTHVLSSFNLYKSSAFSLKTLMENGQRQTATVLLFFQNQKYCELTLKVGLVYDGSYNVGSIPTKGDSNHEIPNFVKLNEVWFSKSLWNSNPLPKEWMQIFGSRYNYNNINQALNQGAKEEQTEEKLLKKILQNEEFQEFQSL